MTLAISDALSNLDLQSARLALFSLEQRLDIEQATIIKWPAVLAMVKAGSLTSLSQEIIALQPRRLGCDYVFWRETPTGPEPIFGLRSTLFGNAGLDWWEIKQDYEAHVLARSPFDWTGLFGARGSL